MSSRQYGKARSRERSPPSRYQRDDDHRSYERNSDRRRRDDFDTVPKSKHAVHIRGLQSNVKSYEVERVSTVHNNFRQFLERKIGGSVSTIFYRPDKSDNSVEIAVRFSDKDSAKICVETLHKTFMLGSTVYIDYYKDVNRHLDHIESSKRGYEDRDRRGRSRSPSRNRRYSRSPQRERSRRTPEPSYPKKAFNGRDSDGDGQKKAPLLPTPDSKPLFHYNTVPVQTTLPPPTNVLPPMNQPPPSFSTMLPYMQSMMNNQSSVVVSKPSVSLSPLPNTNLPPPAMFVPDIPIARPAQNSKFSDNPPPNKSSFDAKFNVPPHRAPNPPMKETWRIENNSSHHPQMQSFKGEARNENMGRLRLGAIAAERTKEEMRREKMARLNPQAMAQVEIKLNQIEEDLRNDKATYKLVTQSLINKDPGLEERLKPCLAEVLEDLSRDYMTRLDAYIDLFIDD